MVRLVSAQTAVLTAIILSAHGAPDNNTTAPDNNTVVDCPTAYAEFLARYPNKTASIAGSGYFCERKKLIDDYNNQADRDDDDDKLVINEFTDLSPEETSMMFGANPNNDTVFEVFQPSNTSTAGLLKWDWIDRMPPIKSQQFCRSCWAFAAIAVVDFHNGKSHSEQQLLDCAHKAGSCLGGDPAEALTYMMKKGSAKEFWYPYKGKSRIFCRPHHPNLWVKNVYRIEAGAMHMELALLERVILTVFHASPRFVHLGGGVYHHKCGLLNPSFGKHAVAVVGFRNHAFKRSYWILRNSWGPDWGIKGYGRFEKGRNLCGFEGYHVYTAGVRKHRRRQRSEVAV